MKKYDRDPDAFDEDDMPCMCEVCNGWFDLEDGKTDPKNEGRVICCKCADERQEAVDRLDEIEECLQSISEAKYTIRENEDRLKELNYDPEIDKIDDL